MPLGELVDILDSKREPITKRDRIEGPYPYYGATGVLDWVSAFLFDEPLVLIGEDGAKWGAGENSAFPVAGKTWVNNHAHVLRPHRDAVVDDWLIYYLNATDLSEFISGMTVPKLNQGRLRDIPIPLPPLKEQKRIVAVLDQAFAALDRARAHAEANLADAENLFASELDAEIAEGSNGWARRPLSSLGAIQTGSTPKTTEPGNFGDDIPFITPGDFRTDGSLDTDNRGLSKRGASKVRLIPSGSALMVCIGATIGKAGFTEIEVATNQQINAITPNDDVSGEFLYYQFITPRFQKELRKRAGQATLPIVSKGKWSELTVHVPPSLSTQMQVVAKMRDMRAHSERLQASYRAKLADISTLRQSLLQKAFSGELT